MTGADGFVGPPPHGGARRRRRRVGAPTSPTPRPCATRSPPCGPTPSCTSRRSRRWPRRGARRRPCGGSTRSAPCTCSRRCATRCPARACCSSPRPRCTAPTPTARRRTARPRRSRPTPRRRPPPRSPAGRPCAPTGSTSSSRRPYAHVGPGQDERFAVGSWTRQIARLERDGGGALLVGDLTAERDLTDVRDVCRAYRLLLDPAVPAGTYNVASGDVVGLGRRRRAPGRPRPRAGARSSATPPGCGPATCAALAGDASRLRAATGWAPMIALDTTLADALEAARGGLAEESG